MPYWKCTSCHHEWEGSHNICDWCKSEGYILEKETPLEKTTKNLHIFLERLKMAKSVEHIYVEYDGQDHDEFDKVIQYFRNKYGEDCKLGLNIDVFVNK